MMKPGLLTPAEFLLWCLATLALGLISWRSLCNPRCHSFFRFFAFSTTAAVLTPNIAYWQHNLFAAYQLASWCLLFAALALVLNGLYLLITRGGHREQKVAEPFFDPFLSNGRVCEQLAATLI